MDTSAWTSLPGELTGGNFVGAQVGPVGFCATVLFGTTLGGGFHGQVVGGRVEEDNFAIVEDGFVGTSVMASEGGPNMRPDLFTIIVKAFDCAANVYEYDPLAIGHWRVRSVVIEQAGEISFPGARNGSTP